MPGPRGRTERVSVPDRDLVELRLCWRVETARQRLLYLPTIGGISQARARPESFAAESIELHALSVHNGVAVVARITLNQARSRAARDIRPHQRQQCASVLELCSNCWPQASVPVANLSSESIHSVEHRQSEPQQQHPAGKAPHRTLDLSWAGPAAAKHGVHFAVNLCVRSRRCSELVVVEQVP